MDTGPTDAQPTDAQPTNTGRTDEPGRVERSASPGDRAARLEARRGEVLGQLVGIEEDLAALRRTREGLSDDDEHDPDGVPLSAQWDRLEGLKQAKLAALAAIEQAIARAGGGSDGLCETCGRPIAAARLAVRPEATTCIECADRGGPLSPARRSRPAGPARA